MKQLFKTNTHTCDLCVVGGGLSGTIAAQADAIFGGWNLAVMEKP